MYKQNNKRIVKNTFMLYVRQILILFVSLYTVRVVLDILGVQDYGVYAVIGGVVSFFSFLRGTMASATQRFFSFALGKGDVVKLKTIFTVNWIIYGGIAIFAFVLLETVGLWFVNTRLNIPAESFESALVVYHFSVMSFITMIIASPFMAIIIAHEDMQIYAFISILEAILKLSVVFLLVYLSGNKLQLYGGLLFVVSVLDAMAYIFVCFRKYQECQFRIFYWDKIILKELIGFTGWTLFGQITTVMRNQAITILLNQQFNSIVVAARAISMNVTSQINVFSNNFNVGLYPPIIKSYASGNKQNMFSLIINGSKITFFLMWIFALPLFLEMDSVLNIWLKNTPPYTVLFTRLALIEVLIQSVSLPITTAARAPGKMKTYELTLGSIQIAIFFVAWLILLIGGTAYSVFIVAIVANIIMLFVRLFIVNKLIHFSMRLFFINVLIPLSMVVFISGFFSYCAKLLLPENIYRIIITALISILCSSICMYYIGLDKNWREKIRSIITNKIIHIIK